MGSTLTVGHIAYANCEPFFHYLRECGFSGEIRAGVPSQLNRFLAAGELDLSPSSSFEYLRNWRNYQLLPDMSISALGEVKSVLLFSPQPLEALKGQEIFLTGESASSVHLLQVILREYFSFEEVLCRVPEDDLENYVRRGQPALLIGDRALRTAAEVPSEHIHDLGELWHRFTGLPFVFALWIIKRETALQRRRQVAEFHAQLRRSLERAFADLPGLAHSVTGYRWYGEKELVAYWECMSYALGEAHLRGLKLYAELLVKYGFLPEMPRFEFLES